MNCINQCYGHAVIQTFYGFKNVSCDYLKAMKTHSPLNVILSNCSSHIEGKHICDGKDYLCTTGPIIIILLVSTLALLLSYTVLSIVRFNFLKRSAKKKGWIMSHERHGNYSLVTPTETYKLGRTALIMYLLLGIRPAYACITTNNNLLIGNSGEKVCLTHGNVTIPRIYKEIKLSEMYETADWILKPEINWACVGGQCPEVADCERMETSAPVLMNDTILKSSCKSIPKGCFFGRGCLLGNLKIKISHKYKVFKIDGLLSTHKEVLYSRYCSLTFSSLFSEYHLNFAIVETERGSWLCPSFNQVFKIGFHVLGDLQILNNKMIIFPWSYIHCGKDWYDSACEVPKSFISTIGNMCENIDHKGLTAIGKIEKIDKNYYIVEDNNINVAVSCPDKLESIVESANCIVENKEIWGIREHSTGIFLAIRATSNQKARHIMIKNPCHNGIELRIECDGLYKFFPISESEGCNVTDKTVSNSEYYHFDDNWIEQDRSMLNSFLKLGWPHYGVLTTTSTTVILWVLIISYICKKL